MYTKCSEIPIFNFFELIKTHDPIHLFEKGSENKKNEVGVEELNEIIKELLVEYNGLTKNSLLMQEYYAKLDIEYLEARYNITKQLISMYLEFKDIDILLTIKRFGWVLDTSKDIEPQLKRIYNNLLGLKNKINIKKINFVKKYGKQTKNPNPTSTLQKQCLYLEVGIPLSYKIDIFSDTIEKFIYWNDFLEQKNKAYKNG